MSTFSPIYLYLSFILVINSSNPTIRQLIHHFSIISFNFIFISSLLFPLPDFFFLRDTLMGFLNKYFVFFIIGHRVYDLIKILLLALALGVVVERACGDSIMVTGTVFCDQCRDGQRSLFDYPLNGMKVAVACSSTGTNNAAAAGQATTNWLGNYAITFEGNPDLISSSNCYAKIIGSTTTTTTGSCVASAGPAQGVRLMFKMFNTAIYAVDSLLSQPAQPMPFCPSRSSTPPVVQLPPGRPIISVPPPRINTPPAARPPPLPPMPFLQASACPSEKWMMPEYKCYWNVVGPDTKVGIAFGVIAARKYGTDMTLMDGLGGRGEIYRTLLREGTTALLNSYNSIQFRYPAWNVVELLNWALLPTTSQRQILQVALRFKRANSGSVNDHTVIPCGFNPVHCKSKL